MKLKRAIIKEEILAITDNYKLSIVLHQFMYWTERVGIKRYEKFIGEEKERDITDVSNLEGGWIYKTAKELSEETLLNVSPSTIRRYIKDLIKKGYLLERNNPDVKFDHTKQYRINLIKIAKDMYDKGYILQGYRFSDLSYSIFQNEKRGFQNENSNFENKDTIPEITTDITTETTNKNTFGGYKGKYPPLSKLKRKESGHRIYPEKFNNLWKLYPDRKGSSAKGGGYKKFRARIKEGVPYDKMVKGVKNYLIEQRNNNNINTKYIMQMKKFFGPQDIWLEYAEKKLKKGGNDDKQLQGINNEKEAESRKESWKEDFPNAFD